MRLARSQHINQTPGINSQIKCVELHPVQPWVAAVSMSDNVTVWDYQNQQVRAPLPALLQRCPDFTLHICQSCTLLRCAQVYMPESAVGLCV
jgi:WD40 repeat protein